VAAILFWESRNPGLGCVLLGIGIGFWVYSGRFWEGQQSYEVTILFLVGFEAWSSLVSGWDLGFSGFCLGIWFGHD